MHPETSGGQQQSTQQHRTREFAAAPGLICGSNTAGARSFSDEKRLHQSLPALVSAFSTEAKRHDRSRTLGPRVAVHFEQHMPAGREGPRLANAQPPCSLKSRLDTTCQHCDLPISRGEDIYPAPQVLLLQ